MRLGVIVQHTIMHESGKAAGAQLLKLSLLA